jgi:hypothetical protein
MGESWGGASTGTMKNTGPASIRSSLGAQALRRLGQLLGRGGEDVLGESTSYILKFYLFLTLLRNFNSLLHAETFSFGGRH